MYRLNTEEGLCHIKTQRPRVLYDINPDFRGIQPSQFIFEEVFW